MGYHERADAGLNGQQEVLSDWREQILWDERALYFGSKGELVSGGHENRRVLPELGH